MAYKSIEKRNAHYREKMREFREHNRDKFNSYCLIHNRRRREFLKEFKRLSNILLE